MVNKKQAVQKLGGAVHRAEREHIPPSSTDFEKAIVSFGDQWGGGQTWHETNHTPIQNAEANHVARAIETTFRHRAAILARLNRHNTPTSRPESLLLTDNPFAVQDLS